jgi:hypothetical protein
MNRLALALALATTLAGSGCYVAPDCNSRSVSVSWAPGFDGPGTTAAEVGQNCLQAGVNWVDIFIDGAPVAGPFSGHFDCRDYGEIVQAVPNGSHVLTVEGIAANGAILYRDEFSFGASGCNDLALPAAVPAAGLINLDYQFFSGGLPIAPQCAGSYLWLSIFDHSTVRHDILSDLTSNPTAYSCGGPFNLAVPAGPYEFRWMEERGAGPTYTLESAYCTPQGLTVAPGTVTVPVPLDTATAACPG